jgi:hypothetical protein
MEQMQAQINAMRDEQPGQGEAADVEDRMSRAINDGTDFVTGHLDLSERETDLANIIANAIGTAWHRQGQPFTWDEFIAENWSADPCSEDDPGTWWDWAPGDDLVSYHAEGKPS